MAEGRGTILVGKRYESIDIEHAEPPRSRHSEGVLLPFVAQQGIGYRVYTDMKGMINDDDS